MHSCNRSEGCRLTGDRETNRKGCSFRILVVVTQNFAAMFADDAIANAEAQTRSLAHILGGEEGIENLFRIGDAGTIVAKRNLDERPGHRTRNLDTAQASGVANRVISVIHDVEKHLLQLVRIPHNLRQRLVEMFDHLNAMTDEVIRTQVNGAL